MVLITLEAENERNKEISDCSKDKYEAVIYIIHEQKKRNTDMRATSLSQTQQ